MKLWIAKNSEVPVHEQIVTQVSIAIASGDVVVGERLPSTGEIARRFDIHANTVSASYQRLVEQGLVEFRAGKGYFVSPGDERANPSLDAIVADAVRQACELGYGVDDILRLLGGRKSEAPSRVLVIESDEGLRAIIEHELSSRLSVPIDGTTFEDFCERPIPDEAQLAAMTDEKPKIDPLLGDGRTCIYLKGRSVADAMKANQRPEENEVVAVASGWNDFVTFARVMLLAAKIAPGSLIVRSTAEKDWIDAISKASIVVCDPLTASSLDGSATLRIFNVVSDESISELAASLRPS